ncbi:MAG: spermidine/putrescine ABC transporter substrate-binding protein [Pseudomonadota bacterium]
MKKNLPFNKNRRNLLKGAAAVGISLSIPPALRAEGKLNFYNWDTYIGENTIAQFEEATGISVQYDLYADNDELFAKLKGGNPGYDLIVPTNDYIERMLLADMLEPVDTSKIENFKNIGSAFLNPAFDPGRKYSVPYMWGTIGLGYRKSAVDEPTSWNDVLASDKYAGRIALMGDAQTNMQMALKAMGKSLNDWSDENLAAAEAMLLAAKPHVAAFAPDNGQDLLLAGEVDIAMEWNGDILQAMDEDDDIGYVVPKEGGLLWEDALCIPKGGKNVDSAYAMINHILDAKVGAEIAEFIFYASPNDASREFLSEDYLNNPAIFPDQATLEACEVSLFPGQEVTRKIDDAWTRIKSAG